MAEARSLLGSGREDLGGAASRGAALLGRSTLEEGIWALFPQLKDVLDAVRQRRAAKAAQVQA